MCGIVGHIEEHDIYSILQLQSLSLFIPDINQKERKGGFMLPFLSFCFICVSCYFAL